MVVRSLPKGQKTHVPIKEVFPLDVLHRQHQLRVCLLGNEHNAINNVHYKKYGKLREMIFGKRPMQIWELILDTRFQGFSDFSKFSSVRLTSSIQKPGYFIPLSSLLHKSQDIFITCSIFVSLKTSLIIKTHGIFFSPRDLGARDSLCLPVFRF